jgi:hypothetical protein
MIKGFDKLIRGLEGINRSLEKADFDGFARAVVKEAAQLMLGQVVPATPVGEYPKASGKKGGTLRRGWTAQEVVRVGRKVEIKLINPINYASYVEYGHRTRKGGWVKGRYMMTRSEKRLQPKVDALVDASMSEYLRGVFDDK